MSDSSTPRSPRRRRFGLWLLLSLALMAGLFALAVLSFTGRVLTAPQWMTVKLEERLNVTLDPVRATLAGVDVIFGWGALPQVHLRDLTLTDSAGRRLATLPDLRASLSGQAMIERRLEVRRVALEGAEVTLRRAADGSFDLALGEAVAPMRAATLGDVLDQIDGIFASPALAPVEAVTIEGLTITYRDARAGRSWTVQDGLMTLDQTPREIAARLFFSLTSDLGVPSEAALSFESVKGSPEARMSANFSDMPAGDVATQSPALAFLAVIDAPISGAMRTGVGPDGSLQPLSAALEIGAGVLNPVEEAPPIRFDRGKSYFSYDPAAQRITFDEVAVQTDALSLQAEGHAYLRDAVAGWPTSLVAQMRLREVVLTPEGVFTEPARFSGGAADLKITLDPFTARIGQAVLLDAGEAAYRGAGTVRAGAGGWHVALDMGVDRISRDRLLSLWPVSLVPGTRRWVENNVLDGMLFDLDAALRLAPGQPARVQLNHEFRDATVQFLKQMPAVEGGFGYITITEKDFLLALDKGHVNAPQGGQLDAAGTVVRVRDLTQNPAYGEIRIRAEGPVEAALSVLDQPPLRLLSRAGQPVDLAQGRASVEAELGLEFRPGIKPDDVSYTVAATLQDVRSETIVKGRVLEGRTLRLSADREELSISGQARLDGVPVQAVWTQRIGPEHAGQSTVEGTGELSPRFVQAFNIGLPAGSVSGAGVGNVTLALTKGEPVRFTLSSDLNRLGLRLPGLGWSKSRRAKGSLQVEGRLGSPPVVERLSINAPGLRADGRVTVSENGGLNEARFSRVRLGEWLDAPVVLRGRGAGRAPAVVIQGGRFDLRDSPVGKDGGGQGGPIELTLDRLTVSGAIALTGVRGRLSTQGGLNGQIRGTVAGGAPVTATLAPSKTGTAIRVKSDDAGGVLRGAGIFEKSRGGSFELVLQPRDEPGDYDGQMTIRDTRVRGAPALAELLSAISVVGILEQLDGKGLVFTEVDADFRLTPDALQVSRGSAIGPSLGISMAGVYDLKKNRMDMQGVISPIYIVNAIGSVLTRKGEGLFGFNYALKGDAKAPRVTVNPLSILTPGMFREIFRRPPPELEN